MENDEFINPAVGKWLGIVFAGILLFGAGMTFKKSVDHTTQLQLDAKEKLYSLCLKTLPLPDDINYEKLFLSCNSTIHENPEETK